MSFTDDPVQRHLHAAHLRARAAVAEAGALTRAGFHGAALVWAVRAAEILMRDFVLAPYYLAQGETWERAMRKGSNVLGHSDWSKAFAKAEEWFGPVDEPLTSDDLNAWEAWANQVVRRRGDVVHGRAVADVSAEDAERVVAFTERMTSWYAQRFLTSDRHPMGETFRALLDAMRREGDAASE
ncbi:MAG: hypothetical protein JWO36_1811 [Myxococcales bacterium]|nr:hypothetical protein [Myxococcales bacterium]